MKQFTDSEMRDKDFAKHNQCMIRDFMLEADDIHQWNAKKADIKRIFGLDAVINYVDACHLIRWSKFMPLGDTSDRPAENLMAERIYASLVSQYGKHGVIKAIYRTNDKGERVYAYPEWLGARLTSLDLDLPLR